MERNISLESLTRFECPHCGAKIRANGDLRGRTVTCPACKATTEIDGREAESQVAAPPPVPAARTAKKRRIWPVLEIAAGIVLVVAVGFVSYLLGREDGYRVGRASMPRVVSRAAAPVLAQPVLAERSDRDDAFVPDPDPVKRMYAAVFHLSNASLQDKTQDQFFRIGLYLKDKKTGKIAPNIIAFAVARDHAEARAIAARTLDVPPKIIDVVEGRIFDNASAFTDKTIGRNILREKHLACLNDPEMRALRILIGIGHEISSEAECREQEAKEFQEEFKALEGES
jgi:hypothetical protein